MIEFVNLMEARNLGIKEDLQDIDVFWCSDQWSMEPIKLGIRYQCLVDENGELNFLGKKKEYKESSVHLLKDLVNEIKGYSLPKNSLFEGYLTFGNNQQKAYQFLKSNEIKDDIYKDLEFYFSDVIFLKNKGVFDLPLFERVSRLKSLISDRKFVKLQQSYVRNKQSVYSSLKNDFKVFLFKNLESIYSFNQSTSWRILKTPISFFMVIMGFVENDCEKYRNMVMALEGGLYKDGKIVKIMNIPVHSNQNKIYIYSKKQELLGKVFEFLASEKTVKGKYQEARFFRIREDIKPEECFS